MAKKNVKRLLAASFAVAGILGAGSAVFAGEITGNGKTITVNSNSICAFSGLEDHPLDPGVTQSWGQIPKAGRDYLTSIGVSPGVQCNGHLHGLKP